MTAAQARVIMTLVPDVSDSELSSIIDSGALGLITVDTNIYHRYGYDLEAGSLLALGQFAKSPITFVTPDIIMGEIKAHMINNSISATNALRTALRDFRKARRPEQKVLDQAGALLGIGDDLTADIEDRWAEFVEMTGVEVLAAKDLLNGDALVRTYLSTAPPFESKEDKKNEFPDAIALLELEARSEKDNKHVLAISKDGGWRAFAATSKWLIVREDLPTALEFFHRADSYVVGRAVSMFDDSERFLLAYEIESALSQFVDNLNPDISADSYLFYDVDFMGASYEGRDSVAEGDVKIIASDDTSVTLAFDMKLKVAIAAEFSFSVHDSIDHDYVPIGTSEETRSVPINAHLVLQVGRESGPEDGPIVLKVESPRFVPVDFGTVEPDLRPDDDA